MPTLSHSSPPMLAGPLAPCLWFDREAEAAAAFYCEIFPNSRIVAVSRYGEGAPLPAGTALVVEFELDGRPFQALNGGPHFRFSAAVSFVVCCQDQATLDHYWARLGEGGSEQNCGWIQDRHGLSWQVVPSRLATMMQDADGQRVARVMQALMPMRKLDLAILEQAYGQQ